MGIKEKLEKAGFRFLKKDWPIVPVQVLKDLGITPEMLRAEFRQAGLYQVMGPHWCYGIRLDIGGGNTRPLAMFKNRRK